MITASLPSLAWRASRFPPTSAVRPADHAGLIPESAVGESAVRCSTGALGLRAVQLSAITTSPSAALGRGDDVQERPPGVAAGLSRVGVTGVEKVVRIRNETFFARLDCFVDLSRNQKGAHMSRFEEVINEAIGQVVLSESPFRAETLAQHIAELVRERQRADRAEVTIAARYPEHKPAPVSGVQTQEIYTLHGRAVAFEHGTRRTVGVSATASPPARCAQEMVAARARECLAAEEFSDEQIEVVLRERADRSRTTSVGLATLQLGCWRTATPRSRPPGCSRSPRAACPRRSTS